MQLRGAVGIRWGPRPDLMIWAYKGIIITALTYGSLVWGHKKLPKYLIDQLTNLNRLAALGVGPIRPKTPQAGLEIILNLTPEDIVITGAGKDSRLLIELLKKCNQSGMELAPEVRVIFAPGMTAWGQPVLISLGKTDAKWPSFGKFPLHRGKDLGQVYPAAHRKIHLHP
jgi:hypothetical protein